MSLRQSGSTLLHLTGSKCARTWVGSKATRISPKSTGTKSTIQPTGRSLSTIRKRHMRPTSPPKRKTGQSRQVNTVSRWSMRRMVKVMSISPPFNLCPTSPYTNDSNLGVSYVPNSESLCVSGIIIGALAVMAMNQMCKTRETHKYSPVPAEPPQR